MMTYLLINLGIIICPLLFSFEKNVRFYTKLKSLFYSILAVSIPFIIWDVIATAHGDWSFNPLYVSGFYLLGLPVEEVLFFITVPYSTIFIYESVNHYLRDKVFKLPFGLLAGVILVLAAGMVLFRGQNYTFTVLLFCIIFFTLQFPEKLKALNSQNFLITAAVSFIPFFIVNYLLTSIPVVIYNDNENWGFRLLTIPAEDLFYSFSMIALWITFYKYFEKKRKKEKLSGSKSVVVIGAGLGGLSAALRLRNAGFDVNVYEQNDYPGGKAGQIKNDSFRFDTGPSLLTMPFVLKDLFKECGLNIKYYLEIIPLDIICRYFYSDGTIINAYPDKESFAREIEVKTKDSADSVYRFLYYSRKIYELTSELFLFTPFRNISDFLNRKAIGVLVHILKIDPFRTMHKANSGFFKDPKTLQIFDRYATYNGSNPFKGPATLNIIPHVEYSLGSFTVRGGISEIPAALYKAAVQKGVKFHFNCKAEKIVTAENKVTGISINGSFISAEYVISNADYWSTESKLLEQKVKASKESFSSSAIIFYWVIKGQFPQLIMHNIIFSLNYEQEFKEIFNEKKVPDDPTVYIYISSKCNRKDAPEGHENWFVMINTPAGIKISKTELSKIKDNLIKKIFTHTGVDIKNRIFFEETATPESLESKTGSYLGSIYGMSSNDRNAAFKRPAVKSKKISGLYYCGGSTHPGGGIPLVLLSGKHCADAVIKDND